MASALVIGYAYSLRLPVAVGLALAIAFAAGTMIAWRGFDWKSFEQRPELLLPLAAVTAAIGVATAQGASKRFAPTYRLVGLFVLLAALWSLSLDASLSFLRWGETPVKAIYQVLGFAVAAAAISVGLRRDWNDMSMLGAGGFVVLLYTKFYQWWWDWMPAYLFFFIVGSAAIAMILVLRRVRAAMAGAVAA